MAVARKGPGVKPPFRSALGSATHARARENDDFESEFAPLDFIPLKEIEALKAGEAEFVRRFPFYSPSPLSLITYIAALLLHELHTRPGRLSTFRIWCAVRSLQQKTQQDLRAHALVHRAEQRFRLHRETEHVQPRKYVSLLTATSYSLTILT